MLTPRPFRFGVLCESARTVQDVLSTAHVAEATGYSTFLIRDHVQEAPFGHQFGPLATLAAVASTTRTLRIGTLVFANDYRPPVLLAKELATLDQLSGGRLEIGFGTGFLQAEYDAAGISFDPPTVRVDRFEEAIRVYKGLLGSDRLTFHGRHYRLSAFESFPRPVQQPHPPILIGAGGRRMLRLAGREAATVSLLSSSTANGVLTRDPALRFPEAVLQQVTWVREGAGSRFDQIELSVVASVVVADAPGEQIAAAARFAEAQGWSGIAPERVLAMPTVLIGTPDQIAAALLERREQFGISYVVVSDRHHGEVAPVVARLAGR